MSTPSTQPPPQPADLAGDSELLSADDLQRITQRAQPTAQAKVLKAMGIPHRLVHGRLVTSRALLRQWIIGGQAAADAGPNWGSVR